MSGMREAILSRLATSQVPVSGDRLASEMGVSRTAIWKHIEAMRRQGIEIAAVSGRGYTLHSDVLTSSALESRLQTRMLGHPCLMMEEVDSTNSEAMRLASGGAKEGLTVLARRQRHGRGRLGRIWYTPEDHALAMSVLLRPQRPPETIAQLTLVAGVACYQALSHFSAGIRIKWPNDLLHEGRKLAGILTEMRAEPGHVQAVVIGIGVNVSRPAQGWPDDIGQPVTDLGSAAGRAVRRLDVAARLLDALEQAYVAYLETGFENTRRQWWEAHMASNRHVRIHNGGGEPLEGVATGLDTDGALLLHTKQGMRRIIAGDLEVPA